MATYGRGQTLGTGINPDSFKQDFSGFTRAAEIQAQGMQNLGANIGGIIKDFGEAKKEQKKIDASNKASAKAIEAAITLGDSYGITGAEETLRPFLDSLNDPSLSPIQKAALLDEGKAMIPNVFGRFDQSQANAAKMAELNARFAPQLPEAPKPTGAPFFVPDPGGKTETQWQRMSDGRVIKVADLISRTMDYGMSQGSPVPTNAYLEQIDSGAFDQEGDVDPMADEVPATGVGGGPGVLNELPLGTRPIKGEVASRFRPATPEEAKERGAVAGQIDEMTNRFYPINPPSGMTIESDGQGGFKMVQGAGVGRDKEQAEAAKQSMDDSLAAMANAFVELDDLGANVSPGNPSIANIVARLRSSGVGQTVEGALGTSAQAQRDLINQLKPSVINAIRESTGMSARAMDSNRELSFYLQMVGDETKAIEANLAALKIIDKRFGSGDTLEKMLADRPAMLAKINAMVPKLERTAPKGQDEGSTQVPPSKVDELQRRLDILKNR